VSALRFALGTAIVLPVVRPSVRGRDRETWIAIAVYGISLGILNVTFFQSFQRLPLGLAVTFAFVGPLCAALVGSRHRRDIAFALLAGAGVVVLGGIDRPGSAAGVAFALVAGCAWVSVAFAGRSVGCGHAGSTVWRSRSRSPASSRSRSGSVTPATSTGTRSPSAS
jgi:inner membrane transporter RhtA